MTGRLTFTLAMVVDKASSAHSAGRCVIDNPARVTGIARRPFVLRWAPALASPGAACHRCSAMGSEAIPCHHREAHTLCETFVQARGVITCAARRQVSPLSTSMCRPALSVTRHEQKTAASKLPRVRALFVSVEQRNCWPDVVAVFTDIAHHFGQGGRRVFPGWF